MWAYFTIFGRDIPDIIAQEKKQLLRKWVAEMKLAPERLEVEITYRLPEPVMNTKVAGARSE
jgi:hypothetical protein